MKPHQLVHRAWQIGSDAVAMTDVGSISGALDFVQACKGTCKCGRPKKAHPSRECEKFDAIVMKPILGCQLNICENHGGLYKEDTNLANCNLTVLAKNLAGWKTLVKIVSKTHENFYKKPRISLTELEEFHDGNLIYIIGAYGSHYGNSLWEGAEEYGLSDDILKTRITEDFNETLCGNLKYYIESFGKENIVIDIQLTDGIRQNELMAKALRKVAEEMSIPCIATANVYYPNPVDKRDQQVVMANLLKCKVKDLFQNLIQKAPELNFVSYSSNHLPSEDELKANSLEEIANTKLVSDMCESYIITSDPVFPNFVCPDNQEPNAYLKQLCREGWRKKIKDKVPEEKHPRYVAQLLEELAVFEEYGLATYFLVVQDMITWAKTQMLVGPGRGSVGGSLAAYLMNITEVDPIPFGLYFSRFINKGRLSKDHISLPDIDTDYPQAGRGKVIKYLQEKYGYDRVAQICNFGTTKGRSALKDVLNAHGACSFDEMNEITKYVPDESKISDDLQEMIEAEGEASIIKWALENNKNDLSKWCEIDDDGNLIGDFADYFAQAIRLEGNKRALGRHASGIVISNCPVSEMGPVVQVSEEKEDLLLIGYDMHSVEAIGLPKIDILGLATLDRLMAWQEIMATQET